MIDLQKENCTYVTLNKGSIGETGPAGEKGDKGDKGSQGDVSYA